MTTHDLLSLVLKYNREIMQHARAKMDTSIADSREWQEAYQIYLDASNAFEDAKRAANHGFPGIED